MNSMLIDNSKINQIVYITKNKIVFIDKTEQKINIKIEELLNKICLSEMTSLKGRKEAVKHIYGFQNNPPLYLTKNVVLIRIEDIITKSTVYLNVIYINKMLQEGVNCKIYFTNNTFLFLCIDVKYITKQYEKAIKIIKNNDNINFI